MRLRILALVAILALAALAAPGAAHGRVCLQADGANLDRGGHGRPGPTGASGDCPDGDLVEFVLGWTAEPPFTGVKNGLDLGLRLPTDNAPVANVTTLEAQYEFGGQVFPLELEPQFNRPGWYTDHIAPTRAGSYTLRVWGTVNTTAGVKVVNFTHQPAVVEPIGDIAFPAAPDDAAALQAKVQALEQQVAALRGEVGAMKANASRNGLVTPQPGNATAGFEGLAALGAVGLAVLAVRRRGS